SKIDGPPLWDGDAKTSKVSFEGWFRALENKLIINRDHFDNDAAMMGYVENRLTGDALEALLPYLSDDHPDKLDTLDALLVWLQSEYVDQTAKQKARKAYQKLSMKACDNLQDFRNEFVRLAGQAKRPRSDWKEDFNDKITSQLRDQLTVAFVSDDVDFNSFVSLALQYDINNKQNYDRRQATRTPASNGGSGSSRSGNRPSGSRTPTSNNATTPVSGKKLLEPAGPEEMKILVTQGKCFNCRKHGHTTRDCPDKH
ncbi:hypothetical protein V8F06_014955, partial [Rhypophila decipiens]